MFLETKIFTKYIEEFQFQHYLKNNLHSSCMNMINPGIKTKAFPRIKMAQELSPSRSRETRVAVFYPRW